VLDSRIQQKTCAGLDHAFQAQPLELALQTFQIGRPVIGQRIERPVVERDGHAAVADFGQERNRVEWIVMGQAVGVVAEEHFAVTDRSQA
jgi:hypothetical protein